MRMKERESESDKKVDQRASEKAAGSRDKKDKKKYSKKKYSKRRPARVVEECDYLSCIRT